MLLKNFRLLFGKYLSKHQEVSAFLFDKGAINLSAGRGKREFLAFAHVTEFVSFDPILLI